MNLLTTWVILYQYQKFLRHNSHPQKSLGFQTQYSYFLWYKSIRSYLTVSKLILEKPTVVASSPIVYTSIVVTATKTTQSEVWWLALVTSLKYLQERNSNYNWIPNLHNHFNLFYCLSFRSLSILLFYMPNS